MKDFERMNQCVYMAKDIKAGGTHFIYSYLQET